MDNNQSDPLQHVTSTDPVYGLLGTRHKTISIYLQGRIYRCAVAQKEYLGETAKIKIDFSSKLAANDGYDGKNPAQGQRLKEMSKEIDGREAFQKCMKDRMAVLEEWKDRNLITDWTTENAFDWKKMIVANGMCKDRNECFCDILLSADETIEGKLSENQKEIEKVDDELLKIGQF